jgi:hypothetical protein
LVQHNLLFSSALSPVSVLWSFNREGSTFAAKPDESVVEFDEGRVAQMR